ncbi:MAG: hypothetical protein ABIG92_06675 [Candidatus Omnitrophota bacterium]
MKIKERFLTTGIGSLPFLDPKKGIDLVYSKFDIPFWPQLPKLGFKENMYTQFAIGLPNLKVDEKNKKIFVDTKNDLSEGLGKIFEAYLSEDHDALGLTEDVARGFFEFLGVFKGKKTDYIKGHITGPISFGLGVTDEAGKSIIYNDALKEGLIKLLEIKACYQIQKLKNISKNVIIFIDEPYLTSFGSSFVSLERKDIILAISAIADKIRSKGAFSGIHCCGNTDWSLLAETGVDIINFDAYQYAEGISLYPEEIRRFLNRGGYLAWGIVPTSEAILKEDENSLCNKLSFGIEMLHKKGIPKDLLVSNSLLTPSCGMGTLTEDLVENILTKISLLGKLAREKLR